ncbi:MAG: hypothetical protein LBT29_07695 [Flavobacteriaceae bacterium]|jgi:hypothetical protein|nr:hypothetical protein [Flavobacteriaceae bacterium]
MKNPVVQYVLLNIILYAAVFFGLDFFGVHASRSVLISYEIIALASLFVFFGVYVSFHSGVVKFLIVYLFFTILKNIFLLFFALKNRPIFKEIVVFCLITYFILLFLEIVFILKSIKYEEKEKKNR